jgi:hypothetical protein
MHIHIPNYTVALAAGSESGRSRALGEHENENVSFVSRSRWMDGTMERGGRRRPMNDRQARGGAQRAMKPSAIITARASQLAFTRRVTVQDVVRESGLGRSWPISPCRSQACDGDYVTIPAAFFSPFHTATTATPLSFKQRFLETRVREDLGRID